MHCPLVANQKFRWSIVFIFSLHQFLIVKPIGTPEIDNFNALLNMWCLGREPWSSGYGWRLTFWRSWVWIPCTVYFMEIFSHVFIVKIVMVFVWKDRKFTIKEAGVGPFLKTCNVSSFDKHKTCWSVYMMCLYCLLWTQQLTNSADMSL